MENARFEMQSGHVSLTSDGMRAMILLTFRTHSLRGTYAELAQSLRGQTRMRPSCKLWGPGNIEPRITYTSMHAHYEGVPCFPNMLLQNMHHGNQLLRREY